MIYGVFKTTFGFSLLDDMMGEISDIIYKFDEVIKHIE